MNGFITKPADAFAWQDDVKNIVSLIQARRYGMRLLLPKYFPKTNTKGEDRSKMLPIKPTIEYDDFAKIDLRVGVIVDAQPHPNADRLLVLKVDVGDCNPRVVCAGIKQFYVDLPGLINKRIVVVLNLKPRMMRGVESQGMLLAASNDDHSKLGLIAVDRTYKGEEIAAGDTVA